MELASRAVWRGQLTKLTKSASEYLNADISQPKEDDVDGLNFLEEELTVMLERIKAVRVALKKANKDERAFVKPEELEKDMEKCVEYEDTAVGAIARLEQRLNRVRRLQKFPVIQDATSVPVTEKQSGVRLPKLQLKTFSGSYQGWLPFWEQFKTTVHENKALSTIDKFNYLQSVLKGKAAAALSGFTPSESCYDGAVALLVDEFGNNEKIIDQQKLLSIKPVTLKTDSTALRCLYNSVVTCTRSLTALGVPYNSYSIILKTLVLRCLPSELRIDFHRKYDDTDANSDEEESKPSTPSKDDTSISCSSLQLGDRKMKAILRYLKREVDSLEKAGEVSRNSLNSSNAKALKTAAGLFTTTTKVNCYFCQSDKHFTSDCDNELSIEQRKDLLKLDGRCFRCTRKGHTSKSCHVRVSCVKCKKKHASSMCEPQSSDRFKSTQQRVWESQKDQCIASTSKPALNLCTTETNPHPLTDIFLQTACVYAAGSHTSESSCLVRIILDGGSQSSFIRHDISRRLDLPVVGTHIMSVAPFGSYTQQPAQHCNRVRLTLRSQFNDSFHLLEAVEVPYICVDVLAVPDNQEPIFCKLNLADSQVNQMKPEPGISILIGADKYWNFVTGDIKRMSPNLTAVHTVFGWTLQGQNPSSIKISNLNLVSKVLLCNSVINEFDFSKLWDLETIGIKKDDTEAETFTKNFCRDYIVKNGDRYVASIPWKNLGEPLANNRAGALGRLRSLTKKLCMEAGRLAEYHEAMRVFISAGFAEKVPNDSSSNQSSKRVYYMPHPPVYRDDKITTKVRIVSDASAHEPFKLSLNDHILTGSNLLADILKILLNFRMGAIGVTADIEKAFLQILLDEDDRDSHRFFWYAEEPKSLSDLPEIEEYRMTRVTFGVTCSPFLLGSKIRKHLEFESKQFPNTCAVLRKCFYMDDLIASVDCQVAGLKLYEESNVIMQRASMNLRQWNSNNDVVRSTFGKEAPPSNMQKVLGIPWFVMSDELTVDMESTLKFITTSIEGTKRNILQMLSRIYDPLGFFSPCIISIKILFQCAWRLKLNWDVELPNDLLPLWNDIKRDLFELKDLTFPRCVLNNSELCSKEVHIFSDASLKGYGCAAYIRTVDRAGKVTVRFLNSKSRVAPLKESGAKELTLPRLELTAALLASRLCAYLRKTLKNSLKAFLWTDSKIILHWIYGDLKKWKPYVANRVKEIRELTDKEEWRHCPGIDNPADLITRGIRAKQLMKLSIWKDGPDWLRDLPKNWPPNEFDKDNIPVVTSLMIEVDHRPELFTADEPLLQFQNNSKWRKLLRITAYCLRFIDHAKGRCHLKCEHSEFLTTSELQRSELYWISYTQRLWYRDEIVAVKSDRKLPSTSKIQTLCPIMDKEGLLRVGSRLRLMDDFQTSFPVILLKESYITELIVRDKHEETLHGGVNLVLTRVRERFWISRGRQLIKTLIKRCSLCRMIQTKPMTQPFAPLPRERMLTSHPFETTGIDFAGPLYTKKSDVQDSVTQKVYIMLFTCATVRAIHLELVPDLTTESCLLGLRRFLARRGTPRYIYSDNARTFKRAAKEIDVLQNLFSNEKFQNFLGSHRISWRFIVERAPWWGGFWERMVRSVKNILKVAIKKSTLNDDELNTLLAETESIINSRPLTYISDDPLDLEPLTPMHFLKSRLSAILQPSVAGLAQPSNEQIRQLWVARCRFTDFIWKRWRIDYLQQLRSLHHNKGGFSAAIKTGNVVQVYDASSPRLFWKLAVVTTIFPGRDGKSD